MLFSAIARLLSTKGRQTTVRDQSQDWLPPLLTDFENVASSLKIRDTARNLALNDMPRQNGAALDDLQQNIVMFCEGEINRLREAARDQARNLETERRSINLDDDLNDINLAKERAVQNIDAMVDLSKRDILNKAGYAHRENLNLNAFRSKMNTGRFASKQPNLYRHFGWLGVLGFLEAVINAYFFMMANPLGLLGGFLQALLYAFTNILVSAVAGYFPLRWCHGQGALKKLGYFLMVVYGIFILAFNLALAILRGTIENAQRSRDVGETLADVITRPEMIAVFRLLADLFQKPNVVTVDGYMLFLVGTTFAMIALYKGLRADDPIPGYGEVTRRAEAAEKDLHELKNYVTDLISRIVDGEITNLDDLLARAYNRAKRFSQLIDQGVHVLRTYSNFAPMIETLCNNLLNLYHTTNSELRGAKADLPVYFGKVVRLDMKISLPKLDDDLEQREKNYEKLVDIREAAKKQRNALIESGKTKRLEFEKIFLALIDELRQSRKGSDDKEVSTAVHEGRQAAQAYSFAHMPMSDEMLFDIERRREITNQDYVGSSKAGPGATTKATQASFSEEGVTP